MALEVKLASQNISLYDTKIVDAFNKDYNSKIVHELTETITRFLPESMELPELCYFDTLSGPSTAIITPNIIQIENLNKEGKELEIARKREDKIRNSMINNAMDLDYDGGMPFNLKIYKDFYIATYTFQIENNREKRGGKSLYSIITKIKDRNMDPREIQDAMIIITEFIRPIIKKHLTLKEEY